MKRICILQSLYRVCTDSVKVCAAESYRILQNLTESYRVCTESVGGKGGGISQER